MFNKLINNHQSKFNLLVFLAPTIIFVFVFIAFPILFSGYLSLTEYNYASDESPKFIGFQGYINTVLHDNFFHTALINQLKFAIPYFIISFFGSLAMAILINELVFGINIFQIIFYLPMIVPISLVGITFAWMLAPDMGVFNRILQLIGLSSWQKDWFSNPTTALYGLVVARSWKMFGFTLIIFLGGLQSIPQGIREAARVDGANFWQEVRYVLIPNLKAYLLIGGIWVIINSLKVFALPQVVTEGGPGTSTLTLYLYSWKAAFQRLDMGKASQIAYLTAAIILIISAIFNTWLKESSTRA